MNRHLTGFLAGAVSMYIVGVVVGMVADKTPEASPIAPVADSTMVEVLAPGVTVPGAKFLGKLGDCEVYQLEPGEFVVVSRASFGTPYRTSASCSVASRSVQP